MKRETRKQAVLAAMNKTQNTRLVAIAAKTLIPTSTLSDIMKELVKEGLVERIHKGTYQLTSEGKAFLGLEKIFDEQPASDMVTNPGDPHEGPALPPSDTIVNRTIAPRDVVVLRRFTSGHNGRDYYECMVNEDGYAKVVCIAALDISKVGMPPIREERA